MLKSTQTSSGLLWFCYRVLVQAPCYSSLQETHQLWQIAMTWVPTGTKWPRVCHQNPSIRTFVWDHIFPNISWDKVRTFALQTISFTTFVCLQQISVRLHVTDRLHSTHHSHPGYWYQTFVGCWATQISSWCRLLCWKLTAPFCQW